MAHGYDLSIAAQCEACGRNLQATTTRYVWGVGYSETEVGRSRDSAELSLATDRSASAKFG
jgi:hypothetical protein